MSNDNAIPAPSASILAKNIYALIDKGVTIEKAVERINRIGAGVFNISPADIAKARTGGAGLIKCETAFGMMVYGTGPFYKSHAFVV